MKTGLLSVLGCGLALLTANNSGATVIDGMNWADGASCTSNIQNYGEEKITANTAWWLTGVPDADANHDDNPFGDEDNDYVAGWRTNSINENIILSWNEGLSDVVGNDLVIHYFGGGKGAGNVYGSVDGETFILLGDITAPKQGMLTAEYDFDGQFDEAVKYVKIERTAAMPKSGMFFDAAAGYIPEPSSLLLIGCMGGVLLGRKRKQIFM